MAANSKLMEKVKWLTLSFRVTLREGITTLKEARLQEADPSVHARVLKCCVSNTIERVSCRRTPGDVVSFVRTLGTLSRNKKGPRQ